MADEIIQASTEEILQVLSMVPQQKPFRFLENIVEMSTKHCIGEYTFKDDEFFYRGHFPGNPVTPGVILVESMAQTGVVALGLFLSMKSGKGSEGLITLFTDANVEFNAMVLPGDKVTITGELEFFRRNKIKSRVEMKKEDGKIAASGVLSGMGVKING